MGVEYFVVALIVFMLIAALIAVETSDLLSSVIAVGAAGFGLSIIDLLLGAPDLAITQVVVEIVALVLLIRMIVTRRDSSALVSRDTLRTAMALLAGGVLLVIAYVAVGGASSGGGTMPPFGHPHMSNPAAAPTPPVGSEYLANAARETGAANAVMAVLLDYRAYDTLGEATVIFVSVLGVYVILRHVGRRSVGPGKTAG